MRNELDVSVDFFGSYTKSVGTLAINRRKLHIEINYVCVFEFLALMCYQFSHGAFNTV